jgi:hypothetical protein
MEQLTQDNGMMSRGMAMDINFGRMVQGMRVTGSMTKLMARGS